MQIYIHRNNQQLGPFTEAEVKAQLASGVTSLQDHVWWEGQANWIPLGQSSLAATLAPTPPASAPAVPSSIPGATAAPYVGGGVPVTSKLAIWALVCGCASLLCGIFASIPAIILGHMGLSEIKKNPALQGRGMALAGMILGYIFTTLIVIYLVCTMVFFFAVGPNVKDIFKTINAQLNAAQATNSADQSATTPDQTTNAPDQNNTPATTNTPDQSTNSAPATTNTPDQSTNSAPATTNTPDQSTNSAPATTNSPDSTTNTPAPSTTDSSTNAAPMNQ